MESFKYLMNSCYQLMQTHFDCLGYNISLYEVFCYSILGALVLFLFFKMME